MGEEKDYLVIRRPEISDALRIAVICSEGWRQTVDGTMSESFQRSIISFWYTEDKVAGDIRRGSYSYVAEVNGVVAGVIGGGMTALDTSKVFVFYVDREYRYRGIGKELRKLQRVTGKEGRSANGSLYRKGMNTACRFTKQEVSYTSATRRRRPKPGRCRYPAGTGGNCRSLYA